MRQRDDGITFTAPADITAVFEKYRPITRASGSDWSGHGIQLEMAAGRAYLAGSDCGNGIIRRLTRPSISDDHGKVWHRGNSDPRYNPKSPDPNETTAVQLANGRVMLNVPLFQSEIGGLVTSVMAQAGGVIRASRRSA